MKLSKNFNKSEFDCKCGNCEMPDFVLHNIQKLANQLQVLRNITEKSITINSGYRCPEHNAKVGGVKTSQHLQGKAADIVIKGILPEVTADLIDTLISEGNMLQGGLGRYNNFTHYDVRSKSRARWNFKN